jgi:hypothetical protein
MWLLAAIALFVIALGAWTALLAIGRNPLPFPDNGSRIFAAASPQAKDVIVTLLAQHGIKERYRFDTAAVQRSIMWDATIINHPSASVTGKLAGATSSIGLVVSDPTASANHAAEFLRSRGFEAKVILDAEPELPIAFVATNAMPGTVLNFRRHVIHLPKPQPVQRE